MFLSQKYRVVIILQTKHWRHFLDLAAGKVNPSRASRAQKSYSAVERGQIWRSEIAGFVGHCTRKEEATQRKSSRNLQRSPLASLGTKKQMLKQEQAYKSQEKFTRDDYSPSAKCTLGFSVLFLFSFCLVFTGLLSVF